MLGRTVLVVDNDRVALRALGRVLELWGYAPRLLDDPAAALREDHDGVVVVVLDRDMPKLSGPEVARALRERWGRDGPRMLLLSGDLSGLEPQEASLFDEVLSKGTALSLLRSALDRLAAHPG